MARGDEIACHGCAGSTTRTCPRPPSARTSASPARCSKELTGGAWPLGWYTGRDSPNTRRLVADHGGYEYDSDYYGDDLPFWLQVKKTDGSLAPHLVVPYTLDTNDMRFVQAQGFNTGDALLHTTCATPSTRCTPKATRRLDRPKMMSIGMHCRLLGKPGRIGALQRFLDHVQAHDRVWVVPPHRHRAPLEAGAPLRPRHRLRLGMTMTLTLDTLNAATQAEFTALLDGTYEHSPWIAERGLARSGPSPRWRR